MIKFSIYIGDPCHSPTSAIKALATCVNYYATNLMAKRSCKDKVSCKGLKVSEPVELAKEVVGLRHYQSSIRKINILLLIDFPLPNEMVSIRKSMDTLSFVSLINYH